MGLQKMNKLHVIENFPEYLTGNKYEVIIQPGEEEFAFTQPKVGKLYRINDVGNENLQFMKFKVGSLGNQIHMHPNIPNGDVVLVLDYLIYKVCRKKSDFSKKGLGKKLSYGLLVKALWGGSYVYRGFLVTSKYNEFDLVTKLADAEEE